MNPLLPPQHFVPDPEARVWADGRLYLYGSYDISGDTAYCSHQLRTFSSADLLHWTDHGVSFRSAGEGKDTAHIVPWDLPLYAPDCVYRDGLYHLFFCLSDATEGVARSPSPTGPFRDAVAIEGAHKDAIDPAVLIDDDGQAYLYWGQFNCRAAKLNRDMTAILPETLNRNLINEKDHGFHEGPSIRKRNGIYYLVYTDTSRGKATCLSYATSRSPLGPFTKRGVIIDNDGCDRETWNNHGSIESFKGRWYVFYHRSSQGSKVNRRACAERIEFDADGLIKEVEMTTQGVEGPLNARQEIGAWRACLLNGRVQTESVGPLDDTGRFDEHLAFIESGNFAAYKYLDFGPGHLTHFQCQAASLTLGGTIELHLDSETGPHIGTCQVTPTTGWQQWKTFECPIPPVQGHHALYLVFHGPNGWLMNLKNFRFK
jgi:hypothetical protein